MPVPVGVAAVLLGVAGTDVVRVGVVVVVTGAAVSVTVGVVATTDGVTVCVTVNVLGGVAGVDSDLDLDLVVVVVVAGLVAPNNVVPEPVSPRSRSLIGRPATTSTLVTTASTVANTAAAPKPRRRHGGAGLGLRRPGRVVRGREAGEAAGRAGTDSASRGTVGPVGLPARGPNRTATGTTSRTRSPVLRSEWLYTALPITVSTLATAAPITVPLTPR
ncbi:MAG: hypothetical protein JWR06_1286 [Jatrophihabitans sp.]|nr:hypothetical protein [Jatrophihabitans sp.]